MGPVLPEKDNDTGKVLPDADLDGLDGTTWRADPDSVDDSADFTAVYLEGQGLPGFRRRPSHRPGS